MDHEAALLSRDRQPLHRTAQRAGTETREIADGLNVDLNETGQVVGFDIDHASRHLDLTTLETVELPLKATRIA
jgi:uncharacterized protein YuzE